MAITIRALAPQEWEIFRAFWLDGLQSHPAFFGGYDAAPAMTPEAWRGIIQGPRHQLFGLFDGDGLIGISAVFGQREDPSGETAIFGMSFITPAYRGRGLSRLLYDARLAWLKGQPRFRRVLLSHRQSNAASRGAHRRYGFVLTGKALQAGPDGDEPEEYYEKALVWPGARQAAP